MDSIKDVISSSSLLSPDEAKQKTLMLARMHDELLELSESLKDNVTTPSKVIFTRTEEATYFFVHYPLISEKHISSQLSYWKDNEPVFPELLVKEGRELSLSVFSDEKAREDYLKFINTNPKESAYVHTSFHFDSKGNHSKTVMVHKDFDMKRKSIAGTSLISYYLSEMTKLDFDYAEKAINVLKAGIEDYLQHRN